VQHGLQLEDRGQRSAVSGQTSDISPRRVNYGQKSDPPSDGFAVAKVSRQNLSRGRSPCVNRPGRGPGLPARARENSSSSFPPAYALEYRFHFT
jgi:hypothetical protein